MGGIEPPWAVTRQDHQPAAGPSRQSRSRKEYKLSSQPRNSDTFRVDKAESGGDDSDFGKEESPKLSNRKPPSRQVDNQRSLSPDYAHLAPKKRPKTNKKEEITESKESLDELLGNESLGFAQAKLAHMRNNLDFAVRSGGTTMQIGSSEDESSDMEFKSRPIPSQRKQAKTTQLRDIKAPRRKKESIDRGLELREDRRRPDQSQNILLRFLDPDQELDLKSGRQRTSTGGKPTREKTMRDGKLVWKDQDLKLEYPEGGKKDADDDDDDLTASEGEFEALPTGPTALEIAAPSVHQELPAHDDDSDTIDEDEEENGAVPLGLTSADRSSSPVPQPSSGNQNGIDRSEASVLPSSPSSPLAIQWEDIRGTMGQRRGRSGRMLVPGQSDDEESSELSASLPIAVSGSAMRMKTFVANSKGKDRARKEEDQAAYEEASALGMKPDFRCSATRQRKRPYSLDVDRSEIVIPIAISRFLRRYQRLGVQFLYDRYKGLKVPGVWDYPLKGGILGDDMGLGKTIQVTAFLAAIMKKTGTKQDVDQFHSRKDQVRARLSKGASIGPLIFGPTALIVCPTSLVDNWCRELETWGYFSVANAEGQQNERHQAYRKYQQGFLDILIVSHSIVVRDIDALSEMYFSVMIVDEAHVIKTPKVQKTIAMKNIKAGSHFALTGTLIQNRYSEMWSVLDFCSPGSFGTHQQWEDTIGRPLKAGLDHDASVKQLADKQVVTELVRDRILPTVFIRRTKASVAQELPDKEDQVIFCPLTPVQEAVYERLTSSKAVKHFLTRDQPCPRHRGQKLGHCCQKPDEDDLNWKGLVLKYLTAFRKVSSHVGLIYPYKDDKAAQIATNRSLFDECFPEFAEEREEHNTLGPLNDHYRGIKASEAAMDKNLSGKWLVLEQLLLSWRQDSAAKNKVLIFSNSVRLLKMLEFWLNVGSFSYEMLHGGHSTTERQESVDSFQNGDAFVFLISTLAGGVGLNLTAANKVVIFDPSWNPANDLQAMDRAFRMGQKRDVNVYRMISTGTLEENMYERQLNKRSAARTLYEGTFEARLHKGHEGSKGDLWGVENLFKYTKGGTVTDRVTRLAHAEDEVLQKLSGVLQNKSQLDLNQMRVRPTEIDYGAGEEAESDVKETQDGLLPTYDRQKDDERMLDFLNLDFPGLRRQTVQEAKASVAEQHIQQNAKEQYRMNKRAGDEKAFEYFKSDTYLNSAVQRKRKATAGAVTSEPVLKKAPKLGKGTIKTSLIEDEDDED